MPDLSPAYRALIDSPRVSARTRALLEGRLHADDTPYCPAVLDAGRMAILRAAVDRVVPQPDARPIDLAARIDAQLAESGGDGWRFDAMPADLAAYRAGLDTLDVLAQAHRGTGFAALDPAAQDDLLSLAEFGHDLAVAPLDRAQMQLWFEELRGDAVRAYVAHPATLDRMGYSGIGYGGDGEPKSGFHVLGIGAVESWEPPAR